MRQSRYVVVQENYWTGLEKTSGDGFLADPTAPVLVKITDELRELETPSMLSNCLHERISKRIVEQIVDGPVLPRASLLVSLHLVKLSCTFGRRTSVACSTSAFPPPGGVATCGAEITRQECAGSASDRKSTLSSHQMAPPSQLRKNLPR